VPSLHSRDTEILSVNSESPCDVVIGVLKAAHETAFQLRLLAGLEVWLQSDWLNDRLDVAVSKIVLEEQDLIWTSVASNRSMDVTAIDLPTNT
jgi:hypothetical protein